MEFLKKLYSKIFGEKTDISVSLSKGLRGTLTLLGTLLISNIDSVSSMILGVIPDSLETISVVGLNGGDLTVSGIIIFALVGVANLLKHIPFTKDNKLIRTISG